MIDYSISPCIIIVLPVTSFFSSVKRLTILNTNDLISAFLSTADNSVTSNSIVDPPQLSVRTPLPSDFVRKVT